MRDGWNFHGDIAIRLEGDANYIFQQVGRPLNTIFDAAFIEDSTFAECMIILLRSITEYNGENHLIDNFVKKCSKYIGVNGNSISPEIAQELYDEFRILAGV